MTLWKNYDIGIANSPIYVLNQYNQTANSNTGNTMFANSMYNVFVTGIATGTFGVDTNKMQVAVLAGGAATLVAGQSANVGVPQHAGWVQRTIGQGGRAGRVQYETLVAMGSIIPTANSDNVQLPEYFVTIFSQPSSNTWNRGNVVNLIVGANVRPSGNATLTYYWQQDGGNASQTWANVQNSGTFASANGNTTFTLSIANNFLVNDNNFRVIVGTAGANNSISSNAKVLWT